MKKLTAVLKFLVIVFAFLLQSMLFTNFAFANVRPNLLLIVTVLAGFMAGKKEGIVIGFICGLFWDLFSGDLLGFYALIFLLIGYVNGRSHSLLFDEDVRLPLLLTGASDLAFSAIVCITQFFLRGRFDFGTYLFKIILPELVFTVIVVLIAYPLAVRFRRLIVDLEQRRAGKFV